MEPGWTGPGHLRALPLHRTGWPMAGHWAAGIDGQLDCLIIGGGPAGLTAALYLARFERHFLLVDAGKPRAASIPKSHNIPVFPDGLSGPDLLARQRCNLGAYGRDLIVDGEVGKIERTAGRFRVSMR